MTAWQPGMKITAGRLNDATPTTVTSGATASTGFTITVFSGWKVNGLTTIRLVVNTTNAITVPSTGTNSGNITPDLTIATLPAGWTPLQTLSASWGNGTTSGELTIDAVGVVTLRAGEYNQAIAAASNISTYVTFVSGNN